MSWGYGTIRISAPDTGTDRIEDIVRRIADMVANDRDYDIDYEIELDLVGMEG
jgi:hypothetical protein